MSQLLFRNRWIALVWAAALCYSIASFFGKDGGQKQLAEAAQDIRTSRVAAARAESAVQQDLEESEVIRGRAVEQAAEPASMGDMSAQQEGGSEGY